MTLAECPQPAGSSAEADWPRDRWVRVLDRIEHRERHIGLRYSGPPIWLEVTMTGPDSDLWPASTDRTLSWNWQSSTPCPEIDELVARGAGDDALVEAVGRYTIENLILNAVHEIGEWFRFDGRRVFPAHIGGPIGPGERDLQGNGEVELRVSFEQSADTRRTGATETALDTEAGPDLVAQLVRTATAPRFTCLPGMTVGYEMTGPVIRTGATGEPATTWRSSWSTSTIDAVGVGAEELTRLVARDVHRALVWHEADRVCRAFHIDGQRPWCLMAPPAPLGADPPDRDAIGTRAISVSTHYAAPPRPIEPA